MLFVKLLLMFGLRRGGAVAEHGVAGVAASSSEGYEGLVVVFAHQGVRTRHPRYALRFETVPPLSAVSPAPTSPSDNTLRIIINRAFKFSEGIHDGSMRLAVGESSAGED
jgi:hypothetical protein